MLLVRSFSTTSRPASGRPPAALGRLQASSQQYKVEHNTSLMQGYSEEDPYMHLIETPEAGSEPVLVEQ